MSLPERCIGLTLSIAAGAALAATASGAAELDTVEVSATRLRSVPDVDVPASVTTLQLSASGNRTETEITEVLAGLPGVTALDRQNFAQDTQLSIRGFGARSTFGVRGLRLYADGVPASMPDGQGQLSHFSLMGADRLQVMRGPFSALYGNSSGGVVQIWSRSGRDGAPPRLRATWGSYDARSLGAQALGTAGLLDYNLAVSRFQTDGYRGHSAARRDSANARLGLDVGESRDLSLVLNYLDIPEAQDPLGLDPASWRADPAQATAAAEQFNTRKSVRQYQGGVVFEQRLGSASTLRAMGYAGSRRVEQFLAIPAATQANPLHSGADIDLDNRYHGADLRWSWQGQLAGRDAEITVGANVDEQVQRRLGFTNFVGSTLGVRGVLRRDERNTVGNSDQFAQAWWQFAPRWSVLAGLRHSRVDFRSLDHYITSTNPDDSGSRHYGDSTPVAGLMFRPSEPLRLYFSTGRGFETPTFNEMSYRADGGAGLAFDLKPSVSNNYELGAKWRGAANLAVDFALFRADTGDELAVARNTGGRSSYRNVGSARRQGLEFTAGLPLPHSLHAELSYTWLDARFRSAYLICVSPGCTVPNVMVPAGAIIPGVPRHMGQLVLGYSPGPWSASLEVTGMSGLVANDVGSVTSPGFMLLNAEIGRNFGFGSGTLRLFARAENLLDKKYVGSVIVNEGNSRFFESGLDRNGMVGAQWQWR
ncbi:MAG: TonB-dependent receptor [Steroidobacteraceae bacterium]